MKSFLTEVTLQELKGDKGNLFQQHELVMMVAPEHI